MAAIAPGWNRHARVALMGPPPARSTSEHGRGAIGDRPRALVRRAGLAAGSAPSEERDELGVIGGGEEVEGMELVKDVARFDEHRRVA